ncbi:MAG TPA: radical SAM protein [Candidatus Nitrosotenuis sp.]|jgi:putative pyruvate formate lyase activating enzyme|nr:radical SAM protein [Candidatus Nitrosotenuis sp.]
MTDFDELWVWDDPALAGRLGWYREVAANRQPAKYLIARRIPVEVPLEAPEDDLWAELSRCTPAFLELRASLRAGTGALPARPAGVTLMDLAVELTRRMLGHCNFCRWHCKVDRIQGTRQGACQLAAESRVGSYFHHRGEELIYRGRHGSGTIFFTSCNMRCSFCQNGDISTDKHNGIPVTPRLLAAMAAQLRLEGCHNINWVGGEPTIHLHTIVEAISLLEDIHPRRQELMHALLARSDAFVPYAQREEEACYQGLLNAPMLWNSNFFMSRPAMDVLRLLTDVWLPDFKFGPGPCAVKLSRTPWYWETVTENLRLIHGWGEDFTIRHLIMPNHLECCTFKVLDWIKEHMPDVPVNVMDQFHPDNFCDPHSDKYDPKYAELSRRPHREEILAAFAYARKLGLHYESLTYEKNTTGLRC